MIMLYRWAQNKRFVWNNHTQSCQIIPIDMKNEWRQLYLNNLVKHNLTNVNNEKCPFRNT